MSRRSPLSILFICVLLFSSAACNLTSLSGPKPTPTSFLPTTPVLASLAAPTTIAAVPTFTLEPVLPTGSNPTPPPTVVVNPAQPTATRVVVMPTTPANITLKIFLIAMNDNGASGPMIGCNDSVVGVNVQMPYTQAVLRASLNSLLALKSKDYGQSGLYNALYQSNLAVESLAINNGEATIRLTGSLTSGGVCDDPRIIAQLEQTALQFSTVNKVTIYVNGKKIQDLLSGRG